MTVAAWSPSRSTTAPTSTTPRSTSTSLLDTAQRRRSSCLARPWLRARSTRRWPSACVTPATRLQATPTRTTTARCRVWTQPLARARFLRRSTSSSRRRAFRPPCSARPTASSGAGSSSSTWPIRVATSRCRCIGASTPRTGASPATGRASKTVPPRLWRTARTACRATTTTALSSSCTTLAATVTATSWRCPRSSSASRRKATSS